MVNREVVICSPVRTAIGTYGGTLKDLPAVDLGAVAIRASLGRAKLSPDDVGSVVMGNVIQAGNKMNPARQAAINGGVPVGVPALTVNRVCGSGAQAIASAAQEVMLGFIDSAVAGGMENMDRAPYLMGAGRWGYRMGDATIFDAMLMDGLNDALANIPVGIRRTSQPPIKSPAKSKTVGPNARKSAFPRPRQAASLLRKSQRSKLPPARVRHNSTRTSTTGRIPRSRASESSSPPSARRARLRPATRPGSIPGLPQ